MALSINGNLTVDEEFRNPSTGNADNEVSVLPASAALISYLKALRLPTQAFRNMPNATT